MHGPGRHMDAMRMSPEAAAIYLCAAMRVSRHACLVKLLSHMRLRPCATGDVSWPEPSSLPPLSCAAQGGNMGLPLPHIVLHLHHAERQHGHEATGHDGDVSQREGGRGRQGGQVMHAE